MKDQVRGGVLRSFIRLVTEDGYLFDCPIEGDSSYDARKLHEVCINHRLANLLEEEVAPVFRLEGIFVDIEFNREGVGPKEVSNNGKNRRVRPDIIIHNRKTGPEKQNFLVVECKKQGAPQEDLEEDGRKICDLMKNERYEYWFGLLVVYGRDWVRGTLFFKSGKSIMQEAVDYS